MGDYTPSTDEVREMWVWEQNASIGLGEDAHGAEFDRMLAARDAKREKRYAETAERRLGEARLEVSILQTTLREVLDKAEAARIAREGVAP